MSDQTPSPALAAAIDADHELACAPHPRWLVWQTTLWGVLLGWCFPLVATFVDLAWHGLSLTWSNVGAVQAGNPLHWIIDTAPLFLGLVALSAGIFRARQSQRAAKVERLLDQRSAQLEGTCASLARVCERQKEAEERRRVLELAFDQAADGMALLDPRGTIVHANRALADMHGRSLSGLPGRHASCCFTAEEFANRFTPFVRRVLGRGSCDAELVHQRSDGSTFPSRTSATSVTDAEGVQVGVVVYCRDIEQEQEAALAVRRSERKLAGMIASMQEGVVYADEDGVVRTVNPCFCDFFGVEADQVLGQRLDAFHGPEVRARLDGLLTDARRGSERVYSVEREVAGRHVNLRIQPVREGDEFLGMVMNLHDVTEQRTARLAAEEASLAKSNFLARVSHEIRTPLSGVIGMTAILVETDLTEPQRDLAQTVQESAEALLGVVDDVLDFSRAEAGNLSLKTHDFRWSHLRDEVSVALAPLAAQKQLHLSVCGDPDLPPYLRGDVTRLRQILVNLGGNAIKFTESGGVALSAEKVGETAEGVTLRFSVTDSGVGLSAKEQRRLFESFYQVDASDTRQHGGLGLGLAISRHLVDLMGGAIGLESSAGEGSCFWFTVTLPRATSAAEPADQGLGGPAAEPEAQEVTPTEPTTRPQLPPVFSYEDLLDLLGGDEALVPEILPILKQDADRMVEQLRRAISDRESRGVVAAAHTLKGVLGSVAGRAAADTARRIERLGRESAFDGAEVELARLETEIAQLVDAMGDQIRQPVAQPA